MTAVDLPLFPSGFTLESKYTQEEGRIYLTGIQALVRLPMDQHRADRRRGLRTATFIAGYRGSPLGGFDLELERNRRLLEQFHIVHSPALNEELAATAVMGSQQVGFYPGAIYDGVLGMWYGKGPGVDRSGDAFKHANFSGTGKNGGVLALGGDDPASKSSTLPSASEVAFYDALIPVLYPGDVQDILDLGLHGFALSRASGLWVAMKIVTNVADGTGTAEVAPDRIRPVIPTVEYDGRPFEHHAEWRLLPPYNLEMERAIHGARLELARRYARENGLNRITVPTRDAWLGLVAAGKTYYDLRQALQELGLDEAALERAGVRLLKVGMIFPLEPDTVKEFARGLREILVIEEKRAFLETFVKDILYGLTQRPLVVGKRDEEDRPLVPAHSELDPDTIARVVAARLSRTVHLPSVEARLAYLEATKERPAPSILYPRTAYYCSGCPHNTSTVVPPGHIAAAGIGCHAMALWMDPAIYGQTIGITQMGGEGAQWIGIAPFTETRHLFQNLGDGTLFHSGSLAISYAVASGVNITYKILYNAAVAMTGGQTATGQLPIPALVRRLEAEGVKRIIITTDDADTYRGVPLAPIAEVWPRERILEAQEVLAATPGVTVLIHDQQCAAEKRRLRKRG
ncbi:MAG: 2-oxoacid ferredoxin oxidoreductase, partial [Chloroflexota bacterium]